MSDEACFSFLKSINYDKQYFIDKGWTEKYYWPDKPGDYKRWWPQSFKDESNKEDNWRVWFPPGFRVIEEFNDCYDTGILPSKCCGYCRNSRSETSYGCRLPEVRTAHDSTVLKGKDHISPGHSNPCFAWDVKFAPHAICDYFIARELTYEI